MSAAGRSAARGVGGGGDGRRNRRRVSALPEYVLDSQELLEGFALEAFEQRPRPTCRRCFSDAIYRRAARPAGRRAQTPLGDAAAACAQALQEVRALVQGPHQPYMAERSKASRGPLADYLQDQLGLWRRRRSAGRAASLRNPARHEPRRHRARRARNARVRPVRRSERRAAASADAEGGSALLGEPGWAAPARGTHPHGWRRASASIRLAIPGRRPADCAGRTRQAAPAAAGCIQRHARRAGGPRSACASF